ncbi:type VI secretion protein VasK [Pandoraea terrae]|uniref:Type VI secretion protein VasK n=1 Tax=Pandoraea terrae TaxID=1537710 RepID=A0A5E4TDK6_9BURK|nr:ImcF-related family protein [Pandoraea terrae]VVD85541.1 type VI secretion protein VasK [Pandoraea terrae]
MTTPTNNLKALAPPEPPSPSGTPATWALVLVAVLLAAVALGVTWLKGEWLDVSTPDAQKTATIWILAALAAVVILHLAATGVGAYSVAGQLFRREAGDLPEAKTVAGKRDARLQALCDELRTSYGWRWRYRMPWLLVTGSDSQVDAVAPGLKQAGVLHVADAILVHAAPDAVEAAVWRQQIRKLRHKRPVDAVVQVERTESEDRLDADLPRKLAAVAADLGWAAPVTLLHPVPATGGQPQAFQAIGAFIADSGRHPAHGSADLRKDHLATLERIAGTIGVKLCGETKRLPYLAQISVYVGVHRERIAAGWSALAASKWMRVPIDGVMFAPVFPSSHAANPAPDAIAYDESGVSVESGRAQPASLLPTWESISRSVRHQDGKHVGWYWPNALATSVTVLMIGWCIAMTISFVGNRQLAHQAGLLAHQALEADPGTLTALRAQLALQQHIETLESRRQHGAPWYLRAGLNRNDEILDALWQPYQTVATRNLQRPVVQTLQGMLAELAQAPADALQSHDAQRRGYEALKAYLMLADPSRSEPAFLRDQIAAAWKPAATIPAGEWADLSQPLARFYADHLKAHHAWRIDVSEDVVTASRNIVESARHALINQIGLANADDTVYQNILAAAKGKYADASLVTLLGGADARGLFTTSRTVPGVYTRAAWDGLIAGAIEKAAGERRVNGDWVLESTASARPAGSVIEHGAQGIARAAAAFDDKRATEDLKSRLTERYFAEYTAAWQGMLNSMQWQPATNLNGAIDQLTRLADAQTSPLIALMKSVQYQAQAGRPSQALTDTLVRKAQSLIGSEDKAQESAVNPLAKPFGPLLAMMGETGANAGGNTAGGAANAPTALNGVSLSRYLTMATTMRLKLQQIAASPDAQAMARSLAQAVFEGKLSELAQARNDAALTAASFGAQWSGFGDALFARPLDTAWQTILEPAAASLNEAWRESIAAPFKAAFDGRYPFFETNADASFAELRRYVRTDTGLIARFTATQLAGVLKPQGDRWVPNELAPQSLQFDPAFLAALEQLSTLGVRLYAQGDAGYRFQIMALPSPNVTRSELSVDGKKIIYFNQREMYTPIAWPGDGLNGHAGLTWHTLDAGVRQAFESSGDWAFLRLLASAKVMPLDSTRYELTWNDAGGEPLRYVLRTQIADGPLALLKLRGFQMPERIFIVDKAQSGPLPAVSSPNMR